MLLWYIQFLLMHLYCSHWSTASSFYWLRILLATSTYDKIQKGMQNSNVIYYYKNKEIPLHPTMRLSDFLQIWNVQQTGSSLWWLIFEVTLEAIHSLEQALFEQTALVYPSAVTSEMMCLVTRVYQIQRKKVNVSCYTGLSGSFAIKRTWICMLYTKTSIPFNLTARKVLKTIVCDLNSRGTYCKCTCSVCIITQHNFKRVNHVIWTFICIHSSLVYVQTHTHTHISFIFPSWHELSFSYAKHSS